MGFARAQNGRSVRSAPSSRARGRLGCQWAHENVSRSEGSRTAKLLAMTLAAHLAAAALVLGSCTAREKPVVSEEAFSDPERRQEILEGTLAAMDSEPKYVDELFRLVLQHPRVLDRLLANTARGVVEHELSQRVASHLITYPRGLQRLLTEIIDAADPQRMARLAIVDTLEARSERVANFLVEYPGQLVAVAGAIVRRAMSRPDTKSEMKELVKDLVTDSSTSAHQKQIAIDSAH
jgi:hypothetical protein